MANRDMEGRSISQVAREMRTETTLRDHPALVRMATSRKTDVLGRLPLAPMVAAALGGLAHL